MLFHFVRFIIIMSASCWKLVGFFVLFLAISLGPIVAAVYTCS